MRSLLFLAMIAACGHATPAPTKPCPPVAIAEPAPVIAEPAAVVAPLDDAQVVERATRFLTAMAARDAKAFDAAAATSFVSFLYGRTYDRKLVSSRFAASSDAPHASRTCDHVQTRIGPSSAIYTAECTDKFPAHGEMPAYDSVGLHSVVLVVEGGAWKVAYTSFQTSSVETERDMWNDTFQRGGGFRTEANQHLLDSVKGKRPGRALDLAMGQGRNVLGLAALGWKVTGVDISDAGIKLAKAAAAKRKLSFDGVVHDIDTYDLGVAKWDLVTLIYAGGDAKLLDRIKQSVRPGGLVVVEFFHKDATVGIGIGGFTSGELSARFAGWKILKDETVEDIADWGLRKTKLVRFAAQRP